MKTKIEDKELEKEPDEGTRHKIYITLFLFGAIEVIVILGTFYLLFSSIKIDYKYFIYIVIVMALMITGFYALIEAVKKY